MKYMWHFNFEEYTIASHLQLYLIWNADQRLGVKVYFRERLSDSLVPARYVTSVEPTELNSNSILVAYQHSDVRDIRSNI